jgi:hypothetical protein|tara:strand:+ start:147 stop:443 length:297 start_codon:yes stop_codon:yes gene_type:complete
MAMERPKKKPKQRKKPRQIKNEDAAKRAILKQLKLADEMSKASKQLLSMNTARPEVLRRAKRYASYSNQLTMRADMNLKDLRAAQAARDRYSKRYGDM